MKETKEKRNWRDRADWQEIMYYNHTDRDTWQLIFKEVEI